MDSNVALLFSGLLGVAVFISGIVMGNTGLFRMQKTLNGEEESEKRVSPWKVVGKGGGRYETFQKYKDKFGNNSLVHRDKFAARLIFVGAIIGFGSLLILKIRN